MLHTLLNSEFVWNVFPSDKNNTTTEKYMYRWIALTHVLVPKRREFAVRNSARLSIIFLCYTNTRPIGQPVASQPQDSVNLNTDISGSRAQCFSRSIRFRCCVQFGTLNLLLLHLRQLRTFWAIDSPKLSAHQNNSWAENRKAFFCFQMLSS